MPDDLTPLILDLVEWVEKEPRAYDDVMEAWRTSFPGLPVWECAVEEGYVFRQWREGQGALVSATPEGRAFLEKFGRIRAVNTG